MNSRRNREKYLSILYGACLIVFTVFVLLKTFVLPEAGDVEVEMADIYETESTEQEAVITADSYTDENIQITLKTERINETDVYFVDIQLTDIQYLKTAFAKDTYGRNINELTSAMAERHEAIVAINGDFYGFRDYGYVIRNGVLYRDNFGEGIEQVFVVYDDGSCDSVLAGAQTAEELVEAGVVQAISFGPALVEDGIVTVAESDPYNTATIAGRNPRTAIGMISPLHYVFVVVDGRTSVSAGYTFYELGNVMADYGCVEAYNLDGGGSSTLYFNGEIINMPTNGTTVGEREVSDIVYIGY